ncbi:HAMP domain-containing sensor histidine kinase [Plantibacter sp. VKM Ac-2876]|uniref:sensor histidine kinase n=1 Tax=Plantibacter sp. VKM Ac-2876 TaxID=2783826 RepID=UPI00188BE9AA|nr:HAMP domain-containing sensor histidine kinase [Plantibacter sp. VKM Ac-2876]MBF4566800.1 HAMP domain-containing histidine kinase [Plantibacter sp. VKM Ac-2876]
MVLGELRNVMRSTRVRILVAILLATTLAMTLVGVSTYTLGRQQTLATIDARLEHSAELIAFMVVGSGDSADAPATSDAAVDAVMRRWIFAEDETAIGVRADGSTVAPSAPSAFRLDDDPQLLDTITARSSRGVVTGEATGDRTVRYAIIPVQVVGDPSVAHVVIATDVHAALAESRGILAVEIVVAVVCLLLLGLVGWQLAGGLLHPIRLLRDAAARITESDLDERIPVVGRDDVSELTTTVNGMLDRLDEAFTSQRQLLDDVGHELKTPLTIVRGHLELLDPSDPAEVAATRDLALDELDRMSSLVADITELSTAGLASTLDREPVDIEAFTASVHEKATAISPEHEWTLGEQAALTADVDAGRLAQAWLQLADNAAKYSPAGSTIVISSRFDESDDPALVLSVADDGPGVPEALRERIFDRFTRVSGGRGVAGSGLGLSIVQAIAAAHGGWAEVEDTQQAGSLFSIRLPLAVADDDEGSDADLDLDPDETAAIPRSAMAQAIALREAQAAQEAAAAQTTAATQAGPTPGDARPTIDAPPRSRAPSPEDDFPDLVDTSARRSAPEDHA